MVTTEPRSNGPWWMRKFIPAHYWVSFGSTVYHPDDADPTADAHQDIMLHEWVHAEQRERLTELFGPYLATLLWYIAYCLLPVPVGFAWFRWKWEREAYMSQIKLGELSPNDAVRLLTPYRCWPKRRMLKWFKGQVRA